MLILKKIICICSLLQLIIPALQYVEIPSDVAKKNEYFQAIKSTPKLQKLLLDFMMDTLFLPYKYDALFINYINSHHSKMCALANISLSLS